jgi:hypothetical protein
MIATAGSTARPVPRGPEPGLGVSCAEAQCDGVPCQQARAICADCDLARQPGEPLPPHEGRKPNA